MAKGIPARLTRRLLALAVLVAGLIGVLAYFYVTPPPPVIRFPGGKRFAFSIIDDTDMTTLARVRPIYGVLERYGLRTTKTVWVYPTTEPENSTNSGDTLSDPAYRDFIVDLQRKGFEIALHGVRGGSSRREDTLRGLETFKEVLGQYPRMFINHSMNKDNLYWGHNLLAFGPLRWMTGFVNRHEFSGHDPGSPYFWGDVAKQRVTYVRRYTFEDINLLNINPSFPYRLDDKPLVNYWFPTANGDRRVNFEELLTAANVERLVQQGGICLVYAHLGSGSFNQGDEVDPRFEARIRELVKHDGWFAPASEILDYLRKQPGWSGGLGLRERVRVDMRYLVGQLLESVGIGAA
jgi:hypothetical protein